jgi:hypothetical protein
MVDSVGEYFLVNYSRIGKRRIYNDNKFYYIEGGEKWDLKT